LTTPNAAPGPTSAGNGRALTAGIASYVTWGLTPLVFQRLGDIGVSPGEILAQRTLWAVPAALVFVLLAKQGGELRTVLVSPRVLGWLLVSALVIGINWSTFIWAVNSGRVLETSLGYYINPLLNMAAGALIFRERIDRVGLAAIGLAGVGVVLQTVALGHLPLVSLVLACSFCAYGIVRKRVAASAQTGLFVESLLLSVIGAGYLFWLARHGGGRFGQGWGVTALLIACGPITAIPLVLFSWAARRIPFSSLGFIQFIAPTMTFFMGVAQGETLTPLRIASFVCIWGGAVVFAFGAWRRARLAVVAQSAA
jgi:chloramphenicol-sensitive protein RarD